MTFSRLVVTSAVFARLAQSQSGAMEFEVASVKLQPSAAIQYIPVMQGGPGTSTPERIHYSGVTLMTLLNKAYAVYPDQVFGPGWLISEKYVIDAIVPAGATKEQFERMMQNLLVQRFKLVLQREERDLSAYNLVVADGGPKLKSSPAAKTKVTGDDAQSAADLHNRRELDSDGCPVARIDGRGTVGSVGTSNCTAFRKYTIPDLIKVLEMMVALESGSYYGRQASQVHIVDKTGLQGEFDFNLKFNLASHIRGSKLEDSLATETANAGGDNSLFEALKRQLGLKLQKTKSRVGVLVVQQVVNKVPTDN